MNLEGLKQEVPCKWRVQSFSKRKPAAVCIPYIDAGTAMDILDNVVGPGSWQSDYKSIDGILYAGIGILVSGEWVWKWDVGTESEAEPIKGKVSDAFKRAGMKWGIGRWLRGKDTVFVKASEVKKEGVWPYPINDRGERIYDLSKHINGKSKPVPPLKPTVINTPPVVEPPMEEKPTDPEQAEIDRLANADKAEDTPRTDMPENFFEFMNKAKNMLKKEEKEDKYLDYLHGEGVKSLTAIKDDTATQQKLRSYVENLLKEEGII